MADNNDDARKHAEEEDEPTNWPDVAMDLTSHPQKVGSWFKRYLRNEVFVCNFYRVHMLYFIVVNFLTSVIVYGEDLANDPTQINGSKLRYVDALFIRASAMTTIGLSNINLGSLTAFQQAVLAILMFLGNITFVSIFVVTIRRKYFKRRLAKTMDNSNAAQRIVRDIEHQKSKKKETRLLHKLTGRSSNPSTMKKRGPKNVNAERPKTDRNISFHHQIKAVHRVVTYPF